MANIPCNDPRHNCGTHFGSRSLFVSKVANVQSTPCPNPRLLFYPSRERTLGTRLVLPLLLKPHANGRNIVGQQRPTLLDITCCVRLHTHPVVGSCRTKFETGQTFIDVQTDATTPNMLGQQCWEFVRPFARSLT